MKGLLWGVLGLTLLDILLTSKVDIPGAFDGVATWLRDWMDPTVPLIKAQAVSTSASTPPVPVQTLANQQPPPGQLPPPATGGVVNTSSAIASSIAID